MDGVGPGTVLGGRFTATTRVSRQAGSERWEANEVDLARTVTVLCLPVDDLRTPLLLDAARVAAGLDIPTCVRILDIGTDGPVAYVVEEALTGATSLTELVREGGLPGEEVRRIAGEVATALDAAHGRGVHHLRLSPDDVFRTPEGTVKVRGLATSAALAGVEESGAQAARTDATGVVALAYAGLTGLWPLPGDSPLDPAPTAFGGVVSPSEISAGVPRDLDALCRIALSGRGGPTSAGDYARQTAPWSSRPIAGQAVKRAPAAQAFSGVETSHSAPTGGATGVGPAGSAVGATGAGAVATGDDANARDEATGQDAVGTPVAGTGAGAAAATVPGRAQSTRGDATTADRASVSTSSANGAASGGPAAQMSGGGHSTSDKGAAKGAAAGLSAAVAGAGTALTSLVAALRRPKSKAPDPDATAARADAAATTPRAATPGGAAGTTAGAAAASAKPAPQAAAAATSSATATVAPQSAVATAPRPSPKPASVPRPDDDVLAPPMPGVPAEPLNQRESRVALSILVAFVLLALILGINGVRKIGSNTDLAFGSGAATKSPTAAPVAPVGPAPLAILSADGFDPLGDKSENGNLAPKVFDGNPDTEWVSEGYDTANMGGLKPGAGVVIDLGPNVTPKLVRLTLKSAADVSVLVASDRSLDGAVTAGSIAGANGTVEIPVPPDAGSRQYVIVWFTSLTRDGDGYFRARLGEVAVLG